MPAAAAAITNAPSPEVAEQNLENAPDRVVSSPDAVAANVVVSPAAAEIIKLAQAGVDENVMLTYVSNATELFTLDSDQIVYLNDIGVPSTVVTAMIQRDQVLKSTNPALASAARKPAPQLAPPAPAEPAPTQMEAPPAGPDVPTTYSAPTVTAPLAPPSDAVAVNASSTYFYDSLAPYGNWVNIEGYGLCWQPTVVVADRTWEPYCNRGHWVYSDCGWYWASDYSWGWAPFHYGRWFHHARRGWCWAPDTVWGPSWVSWRYADDYCGWAPLPPTACYSPGIGFTYYGRSVGFNFSFGLSAAHFTFIAANHFCDPHPWRYRVDHHDVTKIYNNTTVINQVVVNNNRVVNKGIPVERIASASRTKVPTMRIHDTDNFEQVRRGEHAERDGRTLTVYRPKLPEPSHDRRVVGEGVQPARRDPITQRLGVAAPTPVNVRNSVDRNRDGRIRNAAPTAPTLGSQPNTTIQNPQPLDQVPHGNRGEHNDRETKTRPPTARNAPSVVRPPDGFQSRDGNGRSQGTASPAPTAPAQNNSDAGQSRHPDRQRSNPTTTPEITSPAPTPGTIPRQDQPTFRQEAPKLMRQDSREFNQRSVPIQTPPSTPRSEVPAAESRGNRNWDNPNQGSVPITPTYRSSPTAPATPPPQYRSAPPSQNNAPARQDSNPGKGRDGNQDRGDRGDRGQGRDKDTSRANR